MTLLCGLKITHDGGVALIETTAQGPHLVAATEVETPPARQPEPGL